MSMVDTTTVTEGAPAGENTEGTPEGTEVSVQKFTMTVNGVDIEVTEDELKQGYMRQADYTRKTQTLAEQRREAEAALDIFNQLRTNPDGTLKQLASTLGVNLGVAAAGDEWGADDVEIDPVTSEVQTLKAQLAEIQQREAAREIQREVETLKSKYGVNDSDVEDIMRHATKRGIDLQAAYRDMHFDDAFEALRVAQARKQAEQKIAADKQAAGAVHLGVTPTGAGAAAEGTTTERPKGIREAYLLAKQGLKYVGS